MRSVVSSGSDLTPLRFLDGTPVGEGERMPRWPEVVLLREGALVLLGTTTADGWFHLQPMNGPDSLAWLSSSVKRHEAKLKESGASGGGK